MREIEAAARGLGLHLQTLAVRHPDELASVFAAMTTEGAEALIALADAVFWSHRTRVVALAAQHRLPAVFDAREFADAGGLMTYGPSVPDSYARRRLRGQNPERHEARRPAGGTTGEVRTRHQPQDRQGPRLTIPPSLLFPADEVIQ